MKNSESAREPEGDVGIARGLWIVCLRAVGLVSTIYLVGLALFWLFLAVVFGSGHSSISTLEYAQSIAVNSIPAIFYAALGITGLKLLCSRLWFLGHSAILVVTGLAIYAYASPGTLPMFTHWLL